LAQFVLIAAQRLKMASLLRMTDITRRFPGVTALDSVNFDIQAGEVLGLIGENGAGKSTLVKIIGGILRPDEGRIIFDGTPVDILGPHHAELLGVSIIHQEHNLIPNLSIADNIFIGRERRRIGCVVDTRRSIQDARLLLEKVGLNEDPSRIISELSVSQRQMVEVAKALSLNARILIMDEPTSSLTETEAEILFGIISELTDNGVAILYISHKMDEIFRLCDRVQILRDGQDVGQHPMKDITEKSVINLMVGRELESMFEKTPCRPGDEVLRVENLSTETGVKNVSFSIRSGEVLGFAGLVGAGRSEVMRGIFGIDNLTGGTVYIDGKPVSIRRPEDAISYGMGFVPEDRKEQGLILGMTVDENLSLANLGNLNRFGVLDSRKERRITLKYMKDLRIKAVDENQITSGLSGGNQQKVVVGKWLSTEPRILILDEPTRGIDVGAKAEIYHLINDLTDQGVAILLISSELMEIIAMSDRILVMHNGEYKGEIDSENVTQERIMSLALSTEKSDAEENPSQQERT
jgi:ribose transport system ATP-binding protein